MGDFSIENGNTGLKFNQCVATIVRGEVTCPRWAFDFALPVSALSILKLSLCILSLLSLGLVRVCNRTLTSFKFIYC